MRREPITDDVVRRLESISRRMSDAIIDPDGKRLLATFFTNPHLKTDAALAFDEACEAVGLTGMSSRSVSTRVECEGIIIASVRAAGNTVDVSAIDPLSPSACKEKETNV